MKIWIYVDGRQEGPYELEQLLDKPVTPETKVWYEGLPKWYPAGYLDELRPLFDGSLAAKKAAESTLTTNEPEETTATDDTQALQSPQEPVEQNPEPQTEPEHSPAPSTPAATTVATDVPECPPTYIGWGIFLTICCCSPLGVAALAASICVTSFYNSGQYEKARKASEWAVWLIMLAFALGFIPGMILQSLCM